MEVVLSAPRGFCAGVVRAIEIVERGLERFGAPVYVRHEIVHNRYVVDSLRRKGAIFVEELDDVPDASTVIFSAHGVPPEVWHRARARNLNVIDATCPLVTKVHLEAVKYAQDGYSLVVVGHEGHPEVIGTMGQAPVASSLVGTVEEARTAQVRHPDKVVALTQTTLSVQDTKEIIDVLRARFPNLISRNDICYATTNRQAATRQLAARVDIVLVIGARNSSNCNRLREVAEQAGVPAYLVDDADHIDPAWLVGKARVGLTSGASTPEVLVEQVIDKLQPEYVSTIEVTKEDVTFTMPRELRMDDKWARPRSNSVYGAGDSSTVIPLPVQNS
ncbi:MAG: 4-hydroxy-3-methylbut-2-enyl diphosphate reductase [SAR202 cluster bacterium]|nr:4-hydroxy-3-methylbut-2-enyl diphosphate reductase [SAR202 cluster bacterium]